MGNFDMDFDDSVVVLKIVGVGGGGGNAINRMVENKLFVDDKKNETDKEQENL